MPDREMAALRHRLARAGVVPACIDRLAEELAAHIDDLEAEARAAGLDAQESRRVARQRIGDRDLIAAQYAAAQSLLRWTHRYPLAARGIRPVAAAAHWPLDAIDVAVDCVPVMARWATCLILAAFVTAGLFLLMQITISPV